MSKTPIADIFLSYSLADSKAADAVATAAHEAGLDVISSARLDPGANIADALWRALAESGVLVAVGDFGGVITSTVTFELGAAMGWAKPIYLVQTTPNPGPVPPYLTRYPLFPLTRIDDLIRSIRADLEPLSDEKRKKLIKTYVDFGVATDKLIGQPSLIDDFARMFERHTGRRTAGETLVRELLRLRKRGELPRIKESTAKAG